MNIISHKQYKYFKTAISEYENEYGINSSSKLNLSYIMLFFITLFSSSIIYKLNDCIQEQNSFQETFQYITRIFI